MQRLLVSLLRMLIQFGIRESRRRHKSSNSIAYAMLILLAVVSGIVFAFYYTKSSNPPQTRWPTPVPPSVGKARIIDGDTVVINNERIRLLGIDAPEIKQICHNKITGKPSHCGEDSKRYLIKLIGNDIVTCVGEKRDLYGRQLGTCSTQRFKDLNLEMIKAGWAVSYKGYKEQEKQAKAQKRGVWALDFTKPGDWRKQKRTH